MDKLNHIASHKVHILNKQDYMMNKAAGYLQFQQHPEVSDTIYNEPQSNQIKLRKPLDYTDMRREAARSLTTDDIIPEDLSYYSRIGKMHFLRFVEKRCRATIQALLKDGKIAGDLFQIPEIYEVPLEEAKVASLPLINKNEALVSEIIEIIKLIIEERGADSRSLINRVAFFGRLVDVQEHLSSTVYLAQ